MKSTNKIRFIIDVLICALTLMVILPKTGHASAPHTINYQGYLTDSEEYPVDEEVEMIFSLYTVDEEGSALWTETHSVIVIHGTYNVVLGSIKPIDIPFDTQYYLGVKINGDPDGEMSPRPALTSVGYAFSAYNADNADTVNGMSASDLENEAHARILNHEGVSDIHHSKTTNFTELSGQLADSQIPENITRDSELSWNNLSGIPPGFTDNEDNEGITNELDPEVGANSLNRISKWNGSALVAGNIYDNGDIGIGTISPSALLHVKKAGSDSLRWLPQSILEFGGQLFGTSGVRYRTNYGSKNYDIFFNNQRSGLFFDYNTHAIDAGFDYTGAEMVIKENGNVGIGTTSPGTKFHVSGGDAAITSDGQTGLILTSLDGNCWRLTIDNTGGMDTASIACP